jgi:hypothetical protein
MKFISAFRACLRRAPVTHTTFAPATIGNAVILTQDRTSAVIVGGTVHILKRSSSRYGLRFNNGRRLPYCCQDGCCDRGLSPEVASLVRQAKELGAQKVILRTGQRQFNCREIEGLPVEDVSGHVGHSFGEFLVDSAY